MPLSRPPAPRRRRAPARPRWPLVAARGAALVAALGAGLLLPHAAASGVTLQVFAASSLTEAYEDLARGFEARHPNVAVQLTFAGSQALRLQIEQGADADVFASADERHMRALVELGDVVTSFVFARNELAVIVPLDDPAGIETFADLPEADSIVIGVESVPIGAYTRTLLENASAAYGAAFAEAVWQRVVSEESNVRLVRAKVELGEADAAIVYLTDAAASDAVRTVAIPAEVNVASAYYLGRVERTPRTEAADLFLDYVRSPAGRAALAARGFVVDP